MSAKNETAKRLTLSVLIIILLSLALAVTSVSLMLAMVTVEDNVFITGSVMINLNDGDPVIEEHEYLFAPGTTVKKEFFIENKSTCEVYYRLYFQNVSGGLADVLQIRICDGERVLFAGTPNTLSQETAVAADDILGLHEKRELQIYFHFPNEEGNATQELYLFFDLAADAVQVRNNTNKEFH